MNAAATAKLAVNIPKSTYDFFFGQPSVFCATVGMRQATTVLLFEKLREVCEAEGIQPEWDPSNEDAVYQLLLRLQLKPLPKKKPAKNAKS